MKVLLYDIRIIEGENGLFVAMPSKKHQMAHLEILHIQFMGEMRKLIEDAIVAAYNELLATAVEA